ncbi:hypothetical protein VZT92_018414 [Zoarces viviparus]|uniref:Uncharacterized protein n=1 Tax=Zoarces viviparus TaxID=48416 RepID=A0AAW1EJ96_ZOAVI
MTQRNHQQGSPEALSTKQKTTSAGLDHRPKQKTTSAGLDHRPKQKSTSAAGLDHRRPSDLMFHHESKETVQSPPSAQPVDLLTFHQVHMNRVRRKPS